MSKSLAANDILLIGGMAFAAIFVFVLILNRGYRRGPVVIAVFSMLIGLLSPALFAFAENIGSLNWLLTFLAGCMALVAVFLVPMAVIAGLCQSSVTWETRLWHAALVLFAWLLMMGLVYVHALSGFENSASLH